MRSTCTSAPAGTEMASTAATRKATRIRAAGRLDMTEDHRASGTNVCPQGTISSMRRAGLLVVALLMTWSAPGPQARAVPLPTTPLGAVGNDGTELVPAAVHAPLADAPLPVTIGLALLLDRALPETRAREVVAKAQSAYEPLGLRLEVVSVTEATLIGTDAADLL